MANHPGLGGRGRGRAGGAGGSFTREMHTEATALLMEQLLPLLRLHQGEAHVVGAAVVAAEGSCSVA